MGNERKLRLSGCKGVQSGLNTITDFLQKKGIKSGRGSPTRWSNRRSMPFSRRSSAATAARAAHARRCANASPRSDDHHHRTGQTEGTQRRPRGGHQEQRNRPARRNPAAEDPRQNRPLAKTEGRTQPEPPKPAAPAKPAPAPTTPGSGSSRCARGRTCPCTRQQPRLQTGMPKKPQLHRLRSPLPQPPFPRPPQLLRRPQPLSHLRHPPPRSRHRSRQSPLPRRPHRPGSRPNPPKRPVTTSSAPRCTPSRVRRYWARWMSRAS